MRAAAAAAAADHLAARLEASLTLQGSSGGSGGGGIGGTHSAAGADVAALQALRELISWPGRYRDEAAALGLAWPRGLLLHGPPGCGKTALVRAVVAETGSARLHAVTAGDVYGSHLGESERRLREAFEAAARDAAAPGAVSVVFLDEVDALCPRRDAGRRPHESRVVAQLLTLLDGATAAVPPGGGRLVVVGATNRPAALDPALRRPGRLDREVAVPTPSTAQRAAILEAHLAGMTLRGDVDLHSVAATCHGYSAADLAALAREAALAAIASVGLGGSGAAGAAAGIELVPEHLVVGMRRVGASIVRGMDVSGDIPTTSWDDIGGLPDVKHRLQQAVEWPLLHAEAFSRLGLAPPRGVLLYGPPGCSKTTLARAAARASGATLLPLSCAQLYSMYVGEGEALLRDVFQRARLAAPAIVLLDEVDAIAPARMERHDGGGGGEVGVRLLTTLLTEMDGIEQDSAVVAPGADAAAAGRVLVLGATNRPSALDTALLRPGRFDTLLYVPPPDEPGRLQVLRVHTRRMPLAVDVDLAALAAATAGWTGAELAGLCREAALAALREHGVAAGDARTTAAVAARHFEAARAASRAPATSLLTLAAHEAWRRKR